MRIHRNVWLRILEFIVAGIVLDLVENLVVFRVSAGRTLALEEIGVAILVIIPFAIITEIVIDHPRFWHRLFRWRGNKYDHLKL